MVKELKHFKGFFKENEQNAKKNLFEFAMKLNYQIFQTGNIIFTKG